MEVVWNDQERDKLYKMTMMAGEILLRNGAEIFRVQETMIRIAGAFGAKADVYAVSNGIFMTLNIEGYYFSTQIKDVPMSAIHLGRVVAVNDLSRKIVDGKLTMDEAIIKLENIGEIPFANDYLRISFAALGSAAFCITFGGSFYDSIAAFISGVFLYMFTIFADNRYYPKVLKIVIGAAIATLIANISFSLGIGNNFDHIVIGSIVSMFPGVALTTSIRNFFSGDYLSGTIHLVDAILVAASISVGVITILKIWEAFF